MSPWHDPMYSCIDATSQWKYCKAISRHLAVITLWFSMTIWHCFSYLPLFPLTLNFLEEPGYFTLCISFPLFLTPFSLFFFCHAWFSVTWVYLFITLWMSGSIKATAEILLSGYLLVIATEKELYEVLLTIQNYRQGSKCMSLYCRRISLTQPFVSLDIRIII